MTRLQILKSALIGGASALTLAHPAAAKVFDIPSGDLSAALNAYVKQSSTEIFYIDDVVRGHKSRGAKGDLTETAALTQILRGTGFAAQTTASNAIEIVPAPSESRPRAETIRVAASAPRAPVPATPATVETVVVTAQKKSENIQNVPIAVTALSQAQLTERQIAGGPDLVKEVPNLTFSKTNFTGYNLQIRGIGTQAISVTTDPAVAVAFNGTPFIRNHFFEQEFFDLQDVEVLRGPQGTLYGRNATAGVVNIKSALPGDTYEATLSADLGNFSNRRLDGMINIPIVGDKLDIRVAGEWTKRDGYSFNELTNAPIDGRDLWSTRVTLGWKPSSDMQVYLVWEHFQENDDRMRTAKQTCKTDNPPTSIDGVPVGPGSFSTGISGSTGVLRLDSNYLSQGCLPASLYSPDAFEVPYGFSLPYLSAAGITDLINPALDPYASTTQSRNLRMIESALNPEYRAKNDTLELNADYALTPSLTITSQTGFNQDFLWSAEDYNRFNTTPGIFLMTADTTGNSTVGDPAAHLGNFGFFPDPSGIHFCGSNGCSGNGPALPSGAECDSSIYTNPDVCRAEAVFCDPQLGCSNRIVAEDLSDEYAWQFSQEFRLSSNFSGPFNFSVGGNFLHYETEENYYVFINALTVYSHEAGGGGDNWHTIDNSGCIQNFATLGGWQNLNPFKGGGYPTMMCLYADSNPITSLNNEGHNYFLSQNPYTLNSYAGFGEAYYNIASDLKLTGGLRWTEDKKHFVDIPSEVVTQGYGYPIFGVVDQQWDQLTGRAAANWTPKLDFTDQTLVYGSYAHGYKAGGANPPGAEFDAVGGTGETLKAFPIHPLTFKPEFIDAYELGTKNTLLDGALTLNGDIFYYRYKNYQISRIVDRTSINDNFNATVKGAELETSWEAAPGLKFSFAGGYEDTRVANGQSSIDLMDRTAGMPGWMVVKPFPTDASNCILPDYVVAAVMQEQIAGETAPSGLDGPGTGAYTCAVAYGQHLDPVTGRSYQANPSGLSDPIQNITHPIEIPAGYIGFDPATAPNNGEGFAKDLGGNQLPNAPHFTTSLTAEYTLPVSEDWAATLHGDFYWQSQSFARIFNDRPYDKIHGYSNVNISLILTSDNGWQVMGYVKNVFDTTAITGDFLNSDDSGLTTNVFLTDPRLYGVRVTKQLDQNDGFWGSDYSGYELFTDLFADKDGGKPPIWIELGGDVESVGGQGDPFVPPFLAANPASMELWKGTSPLGAQKPTTMSFDEEAKATFESEGSDWIFSAAVRYGRAGNTNHVHHQTYNQFATVYKYGVPPNNPLPSQLHATDRFSDTHAERSETHTILDFQAGKNVGLGMFGTNIESTLSAGIRFAQFSSKQAFDVRARPEMHFKYQTFAAFGLPGLEFKLPYFHTYHATGNASRKFHGVGPSISWTGSVPFAGDLPNGELTMDWGANAALLFGRQRSHVHRSETAHYKTPLPTGFVGGGVYHTAYAPRTGGHNSIRTVTVPNLGGFAGVSWRYQNAKVSFGYRADEFFGAMDGGIDTRKSENVGFFGPYANIAIGLGG